MLPAVPGPDQGVMRQFLGQPGVPELMSEAATRREWATTQNCSKSCVVSLMYASTSIAVHPYTRTNRPARHAHSGRELANEADCPESHSDRARAAENWLGRDVAVLPPRRPPGVGLARILVRLLGVVMRDVQREQTNGVRSPWTN